MATHHCQNDSKSKIIITSCLTSHYILESVFLVLTRRQLTIAELSQKLARNSVLLERRFFLSVMISALLAMLFKNCTSTFLTLPYNKEIFIQSNFSLLFKVSHN